MSWYACPLRLPEIVAALHPWRRSRISAILIAPRVGGGWEAVLTYVAKTFPPPPDLEIAPADVADPADSRHVLALPALGVEAALREQVRELAAIPELGTLQVELVAPTASALQHGWRVATHAGLLHQRRTWLSRIGRRDLGR